MTYTPFGENAAQAIQSLVDYAQMPHITLEWAKQLVRDAFDHAITHIRDTNPLVFGWHVSDFTKTKLQIEELDDNFAWAWHQHVVEGRKLDADAVKEEAQWLSKRPEKVYPVIVIDPVNKEIHALGYGPDTNTIVVFRNFVSEPDKKEPSSEKVGWHPGGYVEHGKSFSWKTTDVGIDIAIPEDAKSVIYQLDEKVGAKIVEGAMDELREKVLRGIPEPEPIGKTISGDDISLESERERIKKRIKSNKNSAGN